MTPSEFIGSLVPKSYISDTEGRRICYWNITLLDNVSLAVFDYDYFIQIDTAATFDSDNLVEYDTITALDTISENYIRGFVIPLNTRGKEEITYYWRIGIKNTGYEDLYSDTASFILNKNYALLIGENLIKALPDYHIYNINDVKQELPITQDTGLWSWKDDETAYTETWGSIDYSTGFTRLWQVIEQSVSSRHTTNLWKFMSMYANELDKVKLELIYTKNDFFISEIRDSQIESMWGKYFGIEKPDYMSFPEYREFISTLIHCFLQGSTVNAIKSVCRLVTGAEATITLIRDTEVCQIVERDDTDDVYYTGLTKTEIADDIDTIWNKWELQNGVILTIQNPYYFRFFHDLFVYIIHEMKPAHIKLYIPYYYNDGIWGYIESTTGYTEMWGNIDFLTECTEQWIVNTNLY